MIVSHFNVFPPHDIDDNGDETKKYHEDDEMRT